LLVEEGLLEGRADHVRLAGVTDWTDEFAEAQARVVAALERTEFSVPELASLPAASGVADAGDHVQRLLFDDRAVRVSQDFVYTAKQWRAIEAALSRHFSTRPALRVADLKDLLGVSRKHAIPLLEYCDRQGLTLRAGDERKRGPRL
jgi:selenocysteine-specific elongation factor